MDIPFVPIEVCLVALHSHQLLSEALLMFLGALLVSARKLKPPSLFTQNVTEIRQKCAAELKYPLTLVSWRGAATP